jgi:cytochrome c oxidase cbb3-type subunit 3
MAQYHDELLEHDYDGIQEMDNFLPRWWLYLFYVSIVFAVLYMLYYHVLDIGYLQQDEYLQEVDPNYVRTTASDARLLGILPEYRSPLYVAGGDITPRMKAMAGPQVKMVLMTAETDTLVYEASTDPASIAAGRVTFSNICSQCHGKLGEGGVGPNLTDDYWLHGATFTNIVKSVKYGYPAKGMVSWMGTLKENEIIDVAAYVQTLRGTNPPNPRAPQGDLVSN